VLNSPAEGLQELTLYNANEILWGTDRRCWTTKALLWRSSWRS